jgi:sulfate adenylyltransferase subunit 1
MADAALLQMPDPTPAISSGGLLRFTTAGSVDDGKSTLIGRLLYDTQSAYDDQIDSLRRSRINRSSGPIDFSLLTDGLRAEREQGITIDVAYRYFSTPRRKFIIADTPGHEQYTRNTATGASTADSAIVLIDVTKGLLSQSRRHAYIANLLGIRHLIFAVNKMDMVAYDEAAFRRVEAQLSALAEQLALVDPYIVPVSALEGDNVVRSSARTSWFEGPPLLEYLETLPEASQINDGLFRLPIQYVIRPNAGFRGFAGQIAAGTISKGDPVIALPSGRETRIRSILSFDGEMQAAETGDSITVTLEDEIDLGRGDLLVSREAPPAAARTIRANLVWMHAEPLDPNKLYLIKHTTRMTRARVTGVLHRVDIETLKPAAAESLFLNDVALVEIEIATPLSFDSYRQNRTMGSFILIDPISNATVAAGMIESAAPAARASGTGRSQQRVSLLDRSERFGHEPAVVWIEDEETLAEQVERALFDEGWLVQLVPAAEFQPSELPAVARVLQRSGCIAVFPASGLAAQQRRAVEEIFGSNAFFAVGRSGESGSHEVEAIVSLLRNWRGARGQNSARARQ